MRGGRAGRRRSPKRRAPRSAVRPGGVDASADAIAAVVRERAGRRPTLTTTPRVVCVGRGRRGARGAAAASSGRRSTARELADEVVIHTDFAIAFDDALRRRPRHSADRRHGLGGVRARPDGRHGALRRLGPDLRRRRQRRLDRAARAVGRDRGRATAASRRRRSPAPFSRRAELDATYRPDRLGRRCVRRPGSRRSRRWCSRWPTPATSAPMRWSTSPSEELVLHVRALARQAVRRRARRRAGRLSAADCSTRGTPLRKRLEHRLKRAVPGAQVRLDDVVPARGACAARAAIGATAASWA